MKKNKFKIIALVCILLLTSGCGTSNYITDEDGNILVTSDGKNLEVETNVK